MTAHRMGFASVLSLGFGLLSPAYAATIESSSHVVAATVFTDRALITRAATIHLPAGTHTISITDLPAGFDEATLRVKGKAVAAVKIGSVDVKHVFMTELANAAEREKTIAMEAKIDQKSLLEGDIRATQTREQFINKIVAQGAEKTDGQTTKLDFSPEKWVQAWGLVQNGMAETQKDLATKQIALRKLDAEIVKLQQELNQVKSTQPKERREAHINYEASADTDMELSLTYQAWGVTWRPVYDARLDTVKTHLDLEQYGQVSQQTGEDWKDIDLTLSTAQPAYGSEMPRITEWWVRIFQPMMVNALSEGSDAMAGAPGAVRRTVSAAAPMMKAQMNVEAAPEEAIVQSTEYAAEFHVPGHVDIKSVNEPSKLFISSTPMKAELAAQTSPRLSPSAYLFAKITNGESYPLIPGMVAKYRDGSFIGNSSLALLRSGETANLSFGVDDRVKVSFKSVHTEQSNPSLVIVGDMTDERHYESKVQNLHGEPITITIFDSYPVATDADVTVKLLDNVTTPGYAPDTDKRQGVISWSGSYAPKQEKSFTLGFQVKYPKSKQLMGL